MTKAGLVKALWALLTAIMEIKEKTAMFKRTLDKLQCTLISVVPVIEDMERLNHELGRPEEELESVVKKMEDGTKLVYECAKVHRLNCVSMCRYQAQLRDLEDWLLNHFSVVLMAHMARDQKENLRLQMLNREGRNLLLPGHGEVDAVSRYILSARKLYIAWGDSARYWTWRISDPDASFPEVAELRSVCWLEIKGWIKTSLLPSNRWYVAYFVFSKKREGTFGLQKQAVEVSLTVVGEGDGERRTGYLESETAENRTNYDAVARPLLPEPEAEAVFVVERRRDGLLEVKLGEFFTRVGEDKEVEMGVDEMKDLWWKGGIIVQGIEIRPKP